MMTNNVVSLDAHRPHLVVLTDTAARVIPLSVFEDVKAGKLPVTALPDDVIRLMTGRYLAMLSEITDGAV